MKVLHFILGKAAKNRANGVNQVVAGLAKYSARLGADVRVIGKAESVSAEGEKITRDGFDVIAYSRWSRDLQRALHKGVEWADVVHLHGVYAPWNHWVGRICVGLKTPYIVTLHGGLAPERKKARSSLRKTIYHEMLQKRHLREAAAVHIITEEEGTDLFQFAEPQHVIYIPNGIDLEDYPSSGIRSVHTRQTLQLGYLGRISREKNLDALCQAFGQVSAGIDMRLLLAGPKSNEGAALLLNYRDVNVDAVGPKFGSEKLDFVRNLDLFVHPTLTDVFSIGAMEVLAIGTPLLITRTSNVSHFANSRGFFMCEPSVFGIQRGIIRALSQRKEWPEYVRRGRNLIESRFNWSIAAADMLEAYEGVVRRNIIET